MIKKYNGNKNISGTLIRNVRESKKITKTELCKRLELMGISINRDELYRIENNELMVKDFELAAIFDALNLDMNEVKRKLK